MLFMGLRRKRGERRERWDGGDWGVTRTCAERGLLERRLWTRFVSPPGVLLLLCVCVCVRVCIMRCDFERKSRESGVRRLERESGREVEASAVGDTGGLNNQA